MTKQADDAIRSGARRIDETAHLTAGLTAPKDVSISELEPEERGGQPPIETELADVTLSMFAQGTSIRVRVGNAHNASELYEQIYGSADEANTAMLEGDILSQAQVPDSTQPAGTGILLQGMTVERLLAAGLKRRETSTI